MSNPSTEQYQDTVESLRKLLDPPGLSAEEREFIQGDLEEIEAMMDKLEKGVVEIAAFGEVNSGKSSLLNALLGKKVFEEGGDAGRTRVLSKEQWLGLTNELELHGIGESRLVLVDTPGLNETAGEERAEIAREAVRYADLVLYLTHGDLTESEFSAVKQLHELHKPIILVMTKVDAMRRSDLDQALNSIRGKVGGMIADQDIVFTAASPLVWQPVKRTDGTEDYEQVERPPIIEDLQARILEVLNSEGKAIVALNASLFASDVSERIATLKVRLRKEAADATIRRFMWIKASAVGLNPIALADVAGGILSDIWMIRQLAAVYGQEITRANAGNLLSQVFRAWGVTAMVELVTHIAAGFYKTGTLGVGMAATALPQAAAAAWASYVIGQAASIYFRDGGWGEKGAKKIVQEILENTNPDSVLRPLVDRVKARLGTQPA